MTIWSPKAYAMAGIAAAIAASSPAYAQSNNPFVPSGPASRQEVKMLKERLAKLEAQVEAANKKPPVPAGQAVGNGPGSPVPMPNGAPVVGLAPMGPPAGAPGGMPVGGIPGEPGMPGGAPVPAVIEAPKGAVEAARSAGVRFIGCINGQPKFVRSSGERVTFSAKEVAAAVKAGFLPECR